MIVQERARFEYEMLKAGWMDRNDLLGSIVQWWHVKTGALVPDLAAFNYWRATGETVAPF